ncbi:hypothetical protein HK405_013162 [Cladochytrium tenue]|nr:hypothetical protein HK405_013162 [Cladochytrium tenue]
MANVTPSGIDANGTRPLAGVRVVEFAGLAPVPFTGMMLADFGADVVRIDKVSDFSTDVLGRGKRSVSVNLKSEAGRNVVWKLLERADVVLDPYRPGVLERLGFGPDVILKKFPRSIVARLTGFGQNGDFAGGAMFAVVGVLMALVDRARTGKGQIIDVAMTDGAAYLSTFIVKMRKAGVWNQPRGENMLDGGAFFYGTYKTSDGKFMAVGAIEPQFYAELMRILELDTSSLPNQMDMSKWDEMRALLATTFAKRTRDEWTALFAGTDACVTPVLELEEAAEATHNRQRALFGATGEPRAAPLLSAGPLPLATKPEPSVGEHTMDVLTRDCGFTVKDAEALVAGGAVHIPGGKDHKARL